MPARKWPSTSVTRRNSQPGESCGSAWLRLRRFDTLVACNSFRPLSFLLTLHWQRTRVSTRLAEVLRNKVCDLQSTIKFPGLNLVFEEPSSTSVLMQLSAWLQLLKHTRSSLPLAHWTLRAACCWDISDKWIIWYYDNLQNWISPEPPLQDNKVYNTHRFSFVTYANFLFSRYNMSPAFIYKDLPTFLTPSDQCLWLSLTWW